jgi:integrase
LKLEKLSKHPGVYRTPTGHYTYTMELGDQPAQRCPTCKAKHWVEREPLAVCPACGSELGAPIEERRQRRSGVDEHGKPFATIEAASKARRKALGDVDQGTFVQPSDATLGAFLAAWLEGSRSRLRPTTLAGYRVHVRHNLIPALGAVRLQALTPSRVNAFYASLAAKGLSPKSIRNVHVVLRKALGDGVKWGRLTRNVAALADPPRVSRPEMKVWTTDQMRAFLAHVQDNRLYAGWLLAVTTGMRRGELVGLRWADVDLEGVRLSVVRAIVLVDGHPTISEPKTAKGRRSLSLDPATVAALRAHRLRQIEEEFAWGAAYQGSGLVLTAEDGSAIHPEHFADLFARFAADAKLPRIRLHDVRHSYATAALAAGISPKVVSERLGHATVGLTLDTYSHVLPSIDEEAAARVAGLILGT